MFNELISHVCFFLLNNVAFKHLPRVKFGFLNMDIFLADAKIAAVKSMPNLHDFS